MTCPATLSPDGGSFPSLTGACYADVGTTRFRVLRRRPVD